MPHYNVMGVAKAALEASVRYLAADLGADEHSRQRDLGRADQDARRRRASATSATSCKWNEYNAPLKRNVTIEEVGDAPASICCRDLVARRHRRSPCMSIAATTSSA